MLVGFDFAFALGGSGLPATELWADVEKRCKSDADLLGSRYVEGDSRFWSKGQRPADWKGVMRPTELACVAAKLGNPQTPFQLIGAKQVGKGALAGMRLLHRLQARAAIWPFTATEGRPVLVEIYPRLFLRRAGFGSGKVRSWSDLAAVLAALGSDAPEAEIRPPSDHDTDALVSAAGLRALADQAALWDAPRDDIEAMRRDGWIFGVPAAVRTGTHGG